MRKHLSYALLALVAISAGIASMALAEAKVGQKAPDFSLIDQDGKTVTLAELKGKVVVLEWFNNECPYVVKHYGSQNMNTVASKYADQNVVWLAINSTSGKDTASNKAIASEWKINRPILSDADGSVGKAYGATNTPHMFVIDKEGMIAYRGAIDSDSSPDPKAIPGATNYVAKALDEILAGKPISTPETKAYGCSVKYK